jgi:hypothetical protein
MRSAGYAIGGTLGPFIGGVLAQPAKQFPGFFSEVGKIIFWKVTASLEFLGSFHIFCHVLSHRVLILWGS